MLPLLLAMSPNKALTSASSLSSCFSAFFVSAHLLAYKDGDKDGDVTMYRITTTGSPE
jgi:hypothetical protein